MVGLPWLLPWSYVCCHTRGGEVMATVFGHEQEHFAACVFMRCWGTKGGRVFALTVCFVEVLSRFTASCLRQCLAYMQQQ